MRKIRRVAVLGTGTMGATVAAHLVNCGVEVLLLKASPPREPDGSRGVEARRRAFGESVRSTLLKMKPSPVYQKSALNLIETGFLEEDGARLAACDWICEAVKEDLDLKRALFRRIASLRSPGSIVSTNTSGIPLRALAEGMDEDMARHFLGTHFFNPPRYLKLVELVPGPHTDREVVDTMAAFCKSRLGKGIVHAKDTPNFVANRILAFHVQYVLEEARRLGLRVEEVDALTGPLIGHPSSATFRTMDLVGVDVFHHAVSNVYQGCPNDEQRRMFLTPKWLRRMIDRNLLGEKTGGGFYRKTDEKDAKGRTVIHSIDCDTLEYSPQMTPSFACIEATRDIDDVEERVRIAHTGDDPGSRFLWNAFAHTAVYAANRIPESADSVVEIDNAVKWGFAWELGIFEMWDAIGFRYACDRMRAEGLTLPPLAEALLAQGGEGFYRTEAPGAVSYFDLGAKSYRPLPREHGALVLTDFTCNGRVLQREKTARLVDLGDGILCAEFCSPLNVIDVAVLDVISEGLRRVNEGLFDGLVIGNQGKHFSVGFNLKLILWAINQKNWEAIRQTIRQFQEVSLGIRYCRGPVVAAPHHLTLGGGMEVTQHAAQVVMCGETYGGLTEAGVGLIPAGGGIKEMLRRALAFVPDNLPDANVLPYIRRAFESLAMAKISTSGPELVDLGYLSHPVTVCPDDHTLLGRAKAACRGLVVAGYEPPAPPVLTVLGEPIRAAFRAGIYNLQQGGYASDHDAAVALQAAHALTGGDRVPGSVITESEILELELEGFLHLCGTEKTAARIKHVLDTGKPLRN